MCAQIPDSRCSGVHVYSNGTLVAYESTTAKSKISGARPRAGGLPAGGLPDALAGSLCMRSFANHRYAALLAWMLAAVTLPAADVTISGRVLPAFKLEAASATADPGATVNVQQDSGSRLTVTIDRGTGDAATVRLLLALRTNAHAFRLNGALTGSGPVDTVFGIPRPSGSGLLVAHDAPSGFRAVGGALAAGEPRPLAFGTRISSRGTFSSADNALLVPLDLRLPAGEAGRLQLVLTITP